MKFKLALVIAILVSLIGFGTQPAHAAGDYFSITYSGGGICWPSGIDQVDFPINSSYSFSSPEAAIFTTVLNGAIIGSGAEVFTGSSSYSGVFSQNVPSGTPFPYTYQLVFDWVNVPQLNFTLTAVCNGPGLVPIVTVVYTNKAWPGDDRLNPDPAAPDALYCRNGGDVQVWKIDSYSQGALFLTITKAEIATVKNSKPAKNTVIKASKDGSMKLYYLPATDELSFITTYRDSGKVYSFVWKGCS